jgi:hypothetical protein
MRLARRDGIAGDRRHARAVLFIIVAVVSAGCLGGPPHDRRAAAVVLAPQAILEAEGVTHRPYWLLYDQPGWCSAHEANYDWATAAMAVRLARFRDPAVAHAAFARLTPAYIYGLYRERMAGIPEPVAEPPALAGDEVAMTVYGAPLPAHVRRTTGFTELPVLMTRVRRGRAVVLLESLGVAPETVARTVQALVSATDHEGPTDC